MTARWCDTHWVNVGCGLGWVWFRGARRRFVAVRPDGGVVGAEYRSRDAAILALAKDLRRRERLGVPAEVRRLDDYRSPAGFGRGLAAFLARVSN